MSDQDVEHAGALFRDVLEFNAPVVGVVVLGLFIREALHELLAKVFVIEHYVKCVHVIEVTQRARTCNLHTFHVFESLLFAPYFAIVGDLYCAKPVRKNFQRGAAFGF